MIDDNLIKRIQSMIDRYEDIHPQLAQELLSDYIKLVEQNAELHKELAKFREQSFTVHSNIKCSDIPDNLAM